MEMGMEMGTDRIMGVLVIIAIIIRLFKNREMGGILYWVRICISTNSTAIVLSIIRIIAV